MANWLTQMFGSRNQRILAGYSKYVTRTNALEDSFKALSDEQLSQQRSGECFPRRAALAAGSPAMQAMTSERTNWFQLQTWVRIGTAEFDLYSLMYRQGRQARAVMRSLGTD